MAKRRTIVIATGDERTRGDLYTLFSDANEWERVDAKTGQEALAQARAYEDRITLFFLDAALADDYGLAAVRYLQAPATVDCPPVIILLPRGQLLQDNLGEDVFISEVMETPIEPRVATRRLRILLDLHAYQKKDVSFQHTISRDPLIGLLNGKALADAVEQAIGAAGKAHGLAVHVNMDNMRAINERSGYSFGDRLLVDAATTIVDVLPGDAVVGRPHGDTFLAFIPSRSDASANIWLLETLKGKLHRHYPDAPGGAQEVSACIGAARYPLDGQGAMELFEAAEMASSAAKGLGRNVLLFYEASMRVGKAKQALRLTEPGEITPAPEGGFVPVLSLADGRVLGYDYISVHNEDGLIPLDEAIERLAHMPDKSMIHFLRIDIRRFFYTVYELAGAGVEGVNISLFTVLRGDQAEILPQILQQAMEERPIEAGQVCILVAQEMTLEMSRSRLEALSRDIRALGFRFGVHNVGKQLIADECLRTPLFDQIQLAPAFVHDVVSGAYPRAFVEQVWGYFAQGGAQLRLPATLTDATRVALRRQLRQGVVGAYDNAFLPDRFALMEHVRSNAQAALPEKADKGPSLLHIGEEQYNEIFTRSGIVLLDWRPHEGTVAYSESYDVLFGDEDMELTPRERLDSILHPQDSGRMLDLLMQVKHGRPYADGMFRVRGARGGQVYRWRRFFIMPSTDREGIVRHVFCISIDMDREQREMESIRKQAEIDPLTGLYNRGATERYIRAYLEEQGSAGHHALMIVDADDFKNINDRLGHIAGDEALQFLARQMQSLVRADDIVGRIGGDEFMVFMRNIKDEEMIISRAADICAHARGGNPDWELSCTIGIARYPSDGRTFETLYAKADLALYRAKETGKDRLLLYSGEENGAK